MIGRLLALVAGLGALVSCSFTTAGNFEECKTDRDCGTVAACSQGYCLKLPSGCVRQEAGGSTRAFEVDAGSRIPLAALLPLTENGVADNSELQGLNAMRLAVSEVNDRNGLKNRSFALFVCDTGRVDETTGLQTAWMVENLGVPAILTSGSGQTQLVAKHPVRLDAGTMIISATATSPTLVSTFQNERNVWRVSPPDTLQAKALANLIKADFPDAGGVRVDVVFEDSDYGGGFGQPMADNLLALGFTSTRRPFPKDDPIAQTTVITNLANDSPKATVLIAFPSDVRDLITRARTFPSLTRASGHRWYLTDAVKDPAVLRSEDGGITATTTELDLAIGTAPAQGAGGAFIAFRDSFRARYGFDPNSFSYTSHSYDAMWLVMLSAAFAESAGGLSGPNLGQGMSRLSTNTAPTPLRADKWTELSNGLIQGLSTSVEGASGPLDFDTDAGVPSAPYEVWQVSDGGIRVLRLTNP